MRMIWKNAWMVAAAALCAVSCVETEVDDVQPSPEKRVEYQPLLISLKSAEDAPAEEDTRVMVGDITSSKVYYHWEDRDSIGVLLLNVPTKDGNYCSLAARREEYPNRADFDFEALVPTTYTGSDVHAFVYYPYNPSLVQTVEQASGSDYITKGLSFRVPALQTIRPQEVGALECTRLISRYGMACDFLACEGTEGNFTLQHQTAYFRFKIAPTEEYANDNYKLRRVTVRVGNRSEITASSGEKSYTLTDLVPLAGTYRLGFDYDEETFNGSEQVKLLSSGAWTNVTCEYTEPQSLQEPAYAFLVLSPDKLWNAADNENRYMEVDMEVEITGTDASGNATTQIASCTRYISLSGRTVQRGGLYDVTMAFNAPLDAYTKLDVEEPSNTYVIPKGGNFIFSAATPGNGVTPYDCSWEELAAAGIPKSLISAEKTYAVDWLWASGTLFTNRTAEEVLLDAELDTANQTIALQFATSIPESEWKGNMVLALYETNADGSFKQIVWSWLLWFSQPRDHHFYFANTRPSVDLNNVNWFMMDRNLGAEEAGLGLNAMGLYFQLGRKDPFVGPSTRGTAAAYYDSTQPYIAYLNAEKTESYTLAAGSPVVYEVDGSYEKSWKDGTNRMTTRFNTTVFGSEVASWQSSQLQSGEVLPHRYPAHLFAHTSEQRFAKTQRFAWLHSVDQSASQTKTLFDPCPPGYKVPTTREWDNLKNNHYEFTSPAAPTDGPLGYAHYHYNGPWAYYIGWSFPNNATPTTFYAYGEVQLRCDAGEYYEVDYDNESGYATMGRTYHVGKMSLYGMEDVNLPATGVLSDAGELVSTATNITLWSTGRMDEAWGTFEGYWYGIMGNASTNYANNYVYEPNASAWEPGVPDNQKWAKIYSFYTPSLFTNPFGPSSSGLPRPTFWYDKEGGTCEVTGMSSTINYAAPVRCIRTYNSTAAASTDSDNTPE